jgi:hypothetical protein
MSTKRKIFDKTFPDTKEQLAVRRAVERFIESCGNFNYISAGFMDETADRLSRMKRIPFKEVQRKYAIEQENKRRKALKEMRKQGMEANDPELSVPELN